MEFQLEQAMAILERTPATLRALLEGLPTAWTSDDGDPDAWSPAMVVGHLIHGEENNWMPRIDTILQYGPSRPFTSFDPEGSSDRFKDQSLAQLLALFAQLRRDNLARLMALQLTAAHEELGGLHPTLGAVTLQQLLATWVVHDLNHLGQVAEALAKRYTAAVGPWQAYLPILSR